MSWNCVKSLFDPTSRTDPSTFLSCSRAMWFWQSSPRRFCCSQRRSASISACEDADFYTHVISCQFSSVHFIHLINFLHFISSPISFHVMSGKNITSPKNTPTARTWWGIFCGWYGWDMSTIHATLTAEEDWKSKEQLGNPPHNLLFCNCHLPQKPRRESPPVFSYQPATCRTTSR